MKKLYVNTDVNSATFVFLCKLNEQEYITPEMLFPFVDINRLSQATDFVMNINAKWSNTKSETYFDYRDMYESTVVGGESQEASELIGLKGLYDIQEKHGIDVYMTWINRCWEIGINPWISLRMNDCHPLCKNQFNSNKDFLVKASENGWTLGSDYGYYHTCFDYSVPEVREHFLSYIKEQMQRYNVCGLELDFLREYNCFKYLTADMEECRKIMTGFVREVKAILLDAEKIHGHKIKLMIRLPRDIEHCLYYGFDPVAMASEGLIDTLVTSSRFSGSESGINVDEWREALPGIEILPGIETVAGVVNQKCAICSKEITLGLAARYLSYDPDGLYTFNYFIEPRFFEKFFSPLCAFEELRAVDCEDCGERDLVTLSSITDYKTIYNSALRFPVISEAYESCAGFPKMYRPIPTEVALGAAAKTFEIRTGEIPKGKKCSVIVGFYAGNKRFEVTVNGQNIDSFEEIDIGFIEGIGYQPKDVVEPGVVCYRARFDESILTPLVQTVKVASHYGPKILAWVEINVY